MKLDPNSLMPPDAAIGEALKQLEAGDAKIVLVVDGGRRLLGTVTDGDIRRGILRKVGFDAPLSEVMNSSPVTAREGEPTRALQARMQHRGVRHLPVLDAEDRVTGIETLSNLIERPEKQNLVVLMAGGYGSRLRPLTETSPKPMMTVGNKPLLETIIQTFSDYGFSRFVISVHYRATDISEYFGSGERLGVDISYLREAEPLGTAGALRLLPQPPDGPIIVMNADILTKVNFDHLLDFHFDHEAAATICGREYDLHVPYGVVELDEHRFAGITEKPVHRFFVNAGIYVLEPETLAFIPEAAPFDMPTLFQKLDGAGRSLAVFPIREYWLDIGRLEDLERARDEFRGIFES